MADSTTLVEAQGLDYGVICSNSINLGNTAASTQVTIADAAGVALPDIDDVQGGLTNGAELGGRITVSAVVTDDDDNVRQSMNVVRNPKAMNMQFPKRRRSGWTNRAGP